MNKPDYFPELRIDSLTELAHTWVLRYPAIGSITLHKTEIEQYPYLLEFTAQEGINKNSFEYKRFKKFLPLGRFFPSMRDGQKLLQAFKGAEEKGFCDNRIEDDERCAANNYLARFLVLKPGWVLKNAQRANIKADGIFWKLFERDSDEKFENYTIEQKGDQWIINMGIETASILPNGELFGYFLYLIERTGEVDYKDFILHFDGEYPQESLPTDESQMEENTEQVAENLSTHRKPDKIKEDIWECQQAIISQSIVDDHNKPIHKNKIWKLVKKQLEDEYSILINCKWDSAVQTFYFLKPKKVTEIYHEAIYQKLYQVVASELNNVPARIKEYFKNKIKLKATSAVFDENPGKWEIIRN